MALIALTLGELSKVGLYVLLVTVLPKECKITTENYCHLKGCVDQAYVTCETPLPVKKEF